MLLGVGTLCSVVGIALLKLPNVQLVWQRGEGAGSPPSQAVTMISHGSVGPFATGDHTTFDAAGQCSLKAVSRSITDNQKHGNLIGLFLVGSADKRPLAGRLAAIYGSNDGLAGARTDWVRGQIVSASVPANHVVATTRGPFTIGASVPVRDLSDDRQVDIYGLWAKSQDAALPAPGRPSDGAPPPQSLLCAVRGSLTGFLPHLKSGEPSAYSAIAAIAGALSAAFIGIMALRINVNTVKGQRIHEQIRMVLEIDKELIACPQLWGIYDEPNPQGTKPSPAAITTQTQTPAPQTVITALENLTEPLASLKAALQTAPPLASDLQALSEALASAKDGLREFAPYTLATALETLTRPVGSLKAALASQPLETLATALEDLTMQLPSLRKVLQNQVNLSDSELKGKKKALVYTYLNMFEFVYGFYGRRILMWLRPWPSPDRQAWKSWKEFMRDLFSNSRIAQEVWDEKETKGIYSKSFTKFVNKKIRPKAA